MAGLDLLIDPALQGRLFLWLAGASLALGAAALYTALLERKPSGRRAAALKQRRQDLLADIRAPKRRGLAERGVGVSKTLVKKLRLMSGRPAALARVKLVQAGFRSRDAVAVFLALKLVGPAALAGGAVVLLYGTELYPMPAMAKLALALGAVLFGFYGADIYLWNRRDKRRARLARALPDALDLLVICTEAGLNLDAAMARAGREMRAANTEMADEMELTAIELGFLPEREVAFKNLAERTGLASVRALVGTLAQAERYGTPLAQALRVLAAEMRDERLLKAEEKAARLPATLTVPMILFILPALFVVLIGPGILSVIDAMTDLGY